MIVSEQLDEEKLHLEYKPKYKVFYELMVEDA